MICPHCQAQVQDGSRFCGACGRAAIGTSEAAPVVDPWRDWAGREIAGRYRIRSKLGEGGMGAVFKAEQILLKRVVALKLLKPELVASPTLLRRFNAEAEAVAKLSHPNTVTIYDFGQDRDGTLFIAMEYIEGRSLRSALVADGPFPLARALVIAAQVTASLSDAHAAGVVHRDLKPDNIMLQDRGRVRDIVRVLDFGIAKLRDDNRATTQQSMTQAGDVLGTPQYMSPEQIRGEEIDGRSDIYSLGAILYEMITGRMVFEAPSLVAILSKHLLDQPEPPSRRRPELSLPPELDELVVACLAKDPRVRPPSMEKLGERLMLLASAAGLGSSSDLLAYRSAGELPVAPARAGSSSNLSPVAAAALGAAPTGMPSSAAPPSTGLGGAPQSLVPALPLGGVAGYAAGAPPAPPGPPPALPPPSAVPSPLPAPMPLAAMTPPPVPPPGAPGLHGGHGLPAPHGQPGQAAGSPHAPPGAAAYPPNPYQPGAAPGAPYSPLPPPVYAPPPPPKAGANRGLLFALIALLLLGGGGVAAFVILRDKPTGRGGAGSAAVDAGATTGGDPWGASAAGSSSPGTTVEPDLPTEPNDDDDDMVVDPSAGLAPSRPPKLGAVGGKLFSALGSFRFLVPDEMSPNPSQQDSEDGTGAVWSFTGEEGVAVVIIASPLPAAVDPANPEAAVHEFGRIQGMETVSWRWREVQGHPALSGLYRIRAKNVEMRAESVLYVKAKGFLIVTFLCPQAMFEASESYREVLFTQRISW